MKTAIELAKQHGVDADPEAIEDYIKVQQDTLQACFDLSVEGVHEFKKRGMDQLAEGCDALAANIVMLAKEHSIALRVHK